MMPPGRAVLGALGVLAMVVVGAVVVVGPWRGGVSDALPPAGGDVASPTVAAARPTVVATSPIPRTTVTRAIDGVPAAWRPRCRRAPALDRRASEALVCAVDASTTVEIRRYADGLALAAAYAQLAQSVPKGGRTARSRCAAGLPEDRAWRAGPTSAVAGRYACTQDTAGAHLAWSNDATLVIARANRRDGDLAAAYAWWARAPL